jgi:hypothetical protein
VAEREKCEAQFGEDRMNLDWACANCPKKTVTSLHSYTRKLLYLHTLKAAGYPFSPNDLTPEEWLDLGRIELGLNHDR